MLRTGAWVAVDAAVSTKSDFLNKRRIGLLLVS
jgi:hypothetical protein